MSKQVLEQRINSGDARQNTKIPQEVKTVETNTPTQKSSGGVIDAIKTGIQKVKDSFNNYASGVANAKADNTVIDAVKNNQTNSKEFKQYASDQAKALGISTYDYAKATVREAQNKIKTENELANRTEKANLNGQNPQRAKDMINYYDASTGTTKTTEQINNDYNAFTKTIDSINAGVAQLNDMAKNGQISQEDYSSRFASYEQQYNDTVSGMNALSNYKPQYADYTNEIEQNKQRITDIGRQITSGAVNGLEADALFNEANSLRDRNAYLESIKEDQETLQYNNYYDWIKKNGTTDEVRKFEQMMASASDNWLERRIKNFDAAIASGVSSQLALFDSVKDFAMENFGKNLERSAENQLAEGTISLDRYNEFIDTAKKYVDFSATDDSNWSAMMKDAIARQRQNIYFGEEGLSLFLAQSFDQTVNFLTDALLYGNGSVTNPSSVFGENGFIPSLNTLSKDYGALSKMFLDSATDTVYNDLNGNNELGKKYDINTALLHGALRGGLEYATERIGMDNFVDAMSGKLANMTYGGALNYIAKSVAKQGTAEGLEEVAGWFFEPIVDGIGDLFATGGETLKDENGNFSLEKFISQGYNPKDALQSFAIAFTSAALTGTYGGVVGAYNLYNNITDKGGYIQLKEIGNELQKRIDAGGLTAKEISLANYELNKINEALYNFDGNSKIAKSVDTEADVNAREEARSFMQSMEESLIKAVTPNFEQAFSENVSLNEMVETVRDITNGMLANNNIVIDGGADAYLSLGPQTRSAMLDQIESAKNRNIIYSADLLTTKNGKTIDGMFAPKDMLVGVGNRKALVKAGTLIINPNAITGTNVTFAHETVHNMEGTEGYEKLKELAIRNFTGQMEGEITKDSLRKMAKEVERLKGLYSSVAGQNLTTENAMKEFVAKQVEKVFDNPKNIKAIVKYDSSLAYRLYTNLYSSMSNNLTDKIKKEFLKTYKDMFLSGYERKIGDNSFTDANAQMNIASYEQGGKEILEQYLDTQIEKNSLTKEDKKGIMDQLDFVYKMTKDMVDSTEYPAFSKWQNVVPVIDENNGKVSVVVSNGDYELNIDFSTVCKKRKMMDKVLNVLTSSNDFEEIVKGLKDGVLSPSDMNMIRTTVKKHGFEVSCDLCFVDTKRFRQGEWAGKFTSQFNDMIDMLIGDTDINANTFGGFGKKFDGRTLDKVSLEEMDQSGVKALQKLAYKRNKKGNLSTSNESRLARAILEHPEIRQYVSMNSLFGSESFDAMRFSNPELEKLVTSYGGSSMPKTPHAELAYNNEIRKSNQFNAEDAAAVGGVRVQSFSDFMMNMVFDYIQMFADMEAKKLPGHSYTKVPEYALLFGKTGMKINLSLIPKATTLSAEDIKRIAKEDKALYEQLKANAGLDENGNYLFNEESFNYELAKKIRSMEGYDANVGTIMVGISDNHIWKLLSDPTIDQVIGYHKSGINPAVAAANNMSLFHDYTLEQNTRYKKSKRKVPKSMDFDWYNGKDGFNGMIQNGYDAVKTSIDYVRWCEQNDRIPKFDKFAYQLDENGKIVKDAEGNNVVNPNYYKLLIGFRAYDGSGNIAPQNAIQISGDHLPSNFTDIVENGARFLSDEVNTFEGGMHDYEMQQAKQNAEIDAVVNDIRDNLLSNQAQYSVSDREYMNAVNSGDIETAQKLVDQVANEYGYTKLYHGTNEEFNTFDPTKTTNGKFFGSGIYLTDNADEASTYAQMSEIRKGGKRNVMPLYANLGNALTIDVENPDDLNAIRQELGLRKNAVVSTERLKQYINSAVWNDRFMLNKEHNNPNYDSVVIKNINSPNDQKYNEYIIYDGERVKSANPVTYDDNGDIIPLSKRFNSASDDIRYNISDMNSGYSGWSMSNRAVEAYDEGRKPISKFDANDLRYVNEILTENGIENLHSVAALKRFAEDLGSTGEWHHTSKFLNRTNFYDLDQAIESIVGSENPSEVIGKYNTSDATSNKVDKLNKDSLEKAKSDYKKLSAIYLSGISKYKTMNGLVNALISGKLDIDAEYNNAINKLDEEISKKVDKWRELPADHYRQKSVKEYENDKIGFINSYYRIDNFSSNIKEVQKLKESYADKQKLNQMVEQNRFDPNEFYKDELFNSDDNAKEMVESKINGSFIDNYDVSNNGNVYPKGKKPNPETYANGLENFYEVGDIRYVPNKNNIGYTTQVWDGNKFVYLNQNDSSIRYNVSDAPSFYEDVARGNQPGNKRLNEESVMREMEAQKNNPTQNIIYDEYDGEPINGRNAFGRVLPNDDLTEEQRTKLLSETIEKWMPNADILADKYSMMDRDLIDRATFETYQFGSPTYQTIQNMYNDVIANDVLGEYTGRAAQDLVWNYVQDSMQNIQSQVQYKNNKEYNNNVATNIINQVKAYDGTLDSEQIEMAKAVEKAKEDLKEAKEDYNYEDLAKRILKNGKDLTWGHYKTVEQVFDDVANGDVGLRKQLREDLEIGRATGQAVRVDIKNQANELVKKFDELGIKKGSKESAGLQKFVEKHTNEIRNIDTSTQEGIEELKRNPWVEYGIKELKEEFNYKAKNGKMAWENIVEASGKLADFYEEMIYLTNQTQLQIYGEGVLDQAQMELIELRGKLEEQGRTVNRIKEQMKESGFTPELQAALKKAKHNYNRFVNIYNKAADRIQDGDATRRRLTPIRQNYAHHFLEKSMGEQIYDLLHKNGRKTPTYLSGISDFSKPNSRFASFMAKQGIGNYTLDAIGGLERYAEQASSVIGYNPFINQLRSFIKDLQAEAGGTEMTSFVKWLNDYANDLAGKTNPINRGTEALIDGTTKGIIKKMISLSKGASLKFNIRSSLVQFGNLPNGLAIIQRNGGKGRTLTKSVTSGLYNWVKDMGSDNREVDNSPFMSARFFDFFDGNTDFKTKANNLASWMMTVGDKTASEMIWYSAKAQYDADPKWYSELGYEDAIQYADDVTRRSVAGRDVGEVPMAIQSDLMQFIAPFTTEVNNQWQTMMSMAKNKNIAPLLTMGIASYLMNQIIRALGLKDDPLSDPFTPLINETKKYMDSDDMTVMEYGKNVLMGELGELISQMPGGSTLTNWTFGDDSSNIFGDYNPSRYGSGVFGLNTVGRLAGDLLEGDVSNLGKDVISSFVPGGTQMVRTYEGLESMFNPVNRTNSGNIRYVNDTDNIFDWWSAGAFGKWNTSAAQEYIDSGFKTVSGTGTAGTIFDFLQDTDMKPKDAFQVAKDIASIDSLKDEDGKTINNSRALQVRQAMEEQGIYDEVLEAINNGEYEAGKFNLNKTVVGYDDDEFAKQYAAMFGGSEEEPTEEKAEEKEDKKTSSKTSSKSNSKASSNGKTSSATTTKNGKIGSVGSSKSTNTSVRVGNGANARVDDAMRTRRVQLGSRNNRVSQDGGSVVCPVCGATVTPVNGRCPICGASL